MMLTAGVLVVRCDETVPTRCTGVLGMDYMPGVSMDDYVEHARGQGWRCYQHHRRDLCPTHRLKARQRLRLVEKTI